MTRLRVPPVRILPRDRELLERRARALAAPAEADGEERGPARVLVAFGLRGLPCAVEAASLERVVSRLGRVLGVPADGRGERRIAFVEERPFPVVDLAAAGGGAPRRPEELAAAPALVLSGPDGPLAVAVDAPLELLEDQAIQPVQPLAAGDPSSPRLAGRLADGTSLLAGDWLLDWSRGAVRG